MYGFAGVIFSTIPIAVRVRLGLPDRQAQTMKDLHINIGGPRDQAQQHLSLHVQQGGDRAGVDASQVVRLVHELRAAVEQSQLAADDRRRIARHLETIEDESRSPKPLLEEIQSSLTAVARLAQAATSLAPTLMPPLRALAAQLGLTMA